MMYNKRRGEQDPLWQKFGIYTIINTETDTPYVYVGSTRVSFGKRWNAHKAQLRRGEHSNKFLQAHYDKYGEDAFEFNVLETVSSSDEILKAEQFYLDLLFRRGFTYNLATSVTAYPSTARTIVGKVGRPKTADDKVQEVLNVYNAVPNASLRYIAQQTNVRYVTVRRILLEQGITLNPCGKKTRYKR